MSAPDPADVWTRLAPLLVDLAMSRRDDVEAIARLVPGDSPLVGWNPPASDGQALSSAVSAVDRLRGANGQPSQRLLEDWADAFDRPGPQWTALRAIARAYLDARSLLPAAGSRQAAPSAPAQAPTRAASSRRPVAAPAPAQGQAGSLPKAAADSWARLVPRLIESGQARRVGEPQRAVCDHYRRQGWDPGELTAWVPSPADLEVLVAAEVLRKHLFSTPPSRQALMAGDFIGQLRSLSRHAALMQALAQAYLDAHGVGGPMRPSRGGRGGRGGGGGRGGRRRGGGGRRSDLAETASTIERAAFTLTSDTIAIYIDEVELGTAHGAIAGVVWNGAEPDHRDLPHIATHRRSPEPLGALLRCPRAFPFLVPVRGADGAPARYLPMVRTALQLLLGWLLPLPSRPTRVLVYLERYGEYDPGDDLTPYFAGALDESRVDFPERFASWRLHQVGWEGKSFGYLPWGDLVGYWYLARVVRGERFGGHDCTRLPGYMPVDGDGYRRIRAASRIVGTPAIEEVLDVARDLAGTELGRLVLRAAAPAMAADTRLQERLLDELERRRRDGDPRALRPQEAAVRTLVGELPADAPLRVRLLVLGLALGSGDGERAASAAESFAVQRSRALLLDRELVARLDHAQATAAADRFDFAAAAGHLEQVLQDPAFPYLTPAARARLHGLQGRLRAVDGRTEEAEEAFATALALIADDPGLGEAPRGRERARVACWRAMNALDGGLASGPALLAEALGAPPVEAARALAVLHGEAAEEARSRHHLLLRSLWFNRVDDDAEDAYLDLDESWGELPVQHPGELAGAYRALLLWRADEEEDVVADIFRTALAGTADEGRGPLQRLTLAAVAVAAWACIDDPSFRDLGEREIAAAEAAGAGYAEATLHLRAALAAVDQLDDDADPEVVEEIADRALTALPASWR